MFAHVITTTLVEIKLSLIVLAVESVFEGIQSGQLLQAHAPAAGEGAGEQQLHHGAEAEGRLRGGRCCCRGESDVLGKLKGKTFATF